MRAMKAYNNISGTLPWALSSSITALKVSSAATLSHGRSCLSGTLPASLGDMHSLVHLELSNDRLSGTLPTSLGQLSSLQDRIRALP